MSWDYTLNDPGISLFTACLNAGAPMVFHPGDRILEACCAEEDWLTRAAAAWPECSFIGIDQAVGKRSEGPNWERYREDLLREDAFERESLDAVVSLSAIEHLGLGHYGDPTDVDGDTKAVQNIWRWLKPGGWFYFDVPYDPTENSYRLLGAQQTECRVYDDVRLWERLTRACPGERLFTGYTIAAAPGTLMPKPTQPARPFHYVAMVLKK